MNPLLPKDFKVRVHESSIPFPQSTPKPERNKVAGRPQRQPINRQAAMIISPMRSWIVQPLSEPKLPTHEHKEIEELKAKLKIERNEHAATRDEIGNLRLKLKDAREERNREKNQNEKLRATIKEREDIIRQLEDLRL